MKSLLTTVLLALSLTLSAQIPDYFGPGGGDRAKTWDAYVALTAVGDSDTSYSAVLVQATEESYARGGIGVGYSFNQFWNLNFEFALGAPTVTLDIPDNGTYSNTAYVGSIKLNMDWYALPTRVTPLVTAGVGGMSTSFKQGNYQEYTCYPGYWWDYTCDEQLDTAFNFSWNVGVGVRADITKHIFLKAVVGYEWQLQSQATSNPASVFGTLAIGTTFR